MKSIGTWKDRARRALDAVIAFSLPGGRRVASPLLQVDGYLYPHEAVFLYWVGRTAPADAVLVEIGSFRGRSTLCLAAGLRDGGRGRLHAVDPHVYETMDELRRNIDHFGLLPRVELIKDRSVVVASTWHRPVHAVFIDGDHSFEGAAADVTAWMPHLAPGGLLLMHDSTDLSRFEGPLRVARSVCRVGETFDEVGTIGSLTWARRCGGAPGAAPSEHGRFIDRVIRFIKRSRRRPAG